MEQKKSLYVDIYNFLINYLCARFFIKSKVNWYDFYSRLLNNLIVMTFALDHAIQVVRILLKALKSE